MNEDIRSALETSYIDSTITSRTEHRSRLVVNRRDRGELVLSELVRELSESEEFLISAAFISSDGIEMLLQSFRELADRGIRGRLLTSDYLDFNQPGTLEKLLSIPNLSVRIAEGVSLHTKGYGFRKKNGIFSLIIGSSNLTGNALKINSEWNIRVSGLEDGAVQKQFLDEFNTLWDNAVPLTPDWISGYAGRRRVLQEVHPPRQTESMEIKPNLMQRQAAAALGQLRNKGIRKALLIAATGTGKTYLSAFDVKEAAPRTLLFLVHRQQILMDAISSFIEVLGPEAADRIGLFTGGTRDEGKPYLFATVQTMSRDGVFSQFSPEAFEYIIIDEVHKAGAPSYQKLTDYFRPAFLLGMSATPDRPDAGRHDGQRDIYRLFDYNIASEIRLQQALEADMLCPFHYFGISDITVDGTPLSEESSFSDLVSSERIRHIVENAGYYGHGGDRLRGLVFCSGSKEAEDIAAGLCSHGYRAISLSGKDSIEKRMEAVASLEMEEGEGALDYIVTVDIFNEGIDIPSVNQILMLRPTQSAIVFTQQLGRGLRKCRGKEFTVVIDFIANYSSNYLIPIALSGDSSYRKDSLRRFVTEGRLLLPGSSTVSFDEISRQRIFRSIDRSDFSETALLKREYYALKEKLGHIPEMDEFRKHGAIDVMRLAEKCGSYYDFLVRFDSEYSIRLDGAEAEIIRFLSAKTAYGKRASELLLLEAVLQYRASSQLMSLWEESFRKETGEVLTELEKTSAIAYLTGGFHLSREVRKYSHAVFLEHSEGTWHASPAFLSMLDRNPVFTSMVRAIISFGLSEYRRSYSSRYMGTDFTLYGKYTYTDVCHLLNWKQDLPPLGISGYKYDEYTGTLPVFINYIKGTKDDAGAEYENSFPDEESVIAFSKLNRSTESRDAERIYRRKGYEETRIFLFVRRCKDDAEAKEFYFLGEMEAEGKPEEVEINGSSAFRIHYHLRTPVRKDIFTYLTSSEPI